MDKEVNFCDTLMIPMNFNNYKYKDGVMEDIHKGDKINLRLWLEQKQLIIKQRDLKDGLTKLVTSLARDPHPEINPNQIILLNTRYKRNGINHYVPQEVKIETINSLNKIKYQKYNEILTGAEM